MSVLQDICEWTRLAFDKRYKPEQIGFLFGTVEPGEVILGQHLGVSRPMEKELQSNIELR